MGQVLVLVRTEPVTLAAAEGPQGLNKEVKCGPTIVFQLVLKYKPGS